MTSRSDPQIQNDSGDFPVHNNQSLWIKVEKLGVISNAMGPARVWLINAPLTAQYKFCALVRPGA